MLAKQLSIKFNPSNCYIFIKTYQRLILKWQISISQLDKLISPYMISCMVKQAAICNNIRTTDTYSLSGFLFVSIRFIHSSNKWLNLQFNINSFKDIGVCMLPIKIYVLVKCNSI